MEHRSIESKVIASYGYDADTETLEVEFKNGKRYRYHPLTVEQFFEFEAAESKGKHFGQHIRNSIPFEKVEPEEQEKHEGEASGDGSGELFGEGAPSPR